MNKTETKKVPRLRFREFTDEWQVKKLGDIFNYKNGGAFENNLVDQGLYKLITLNSINIDGNLKQKHKTVNRADWYLKKDDLVMVLSDVAHGNFLGLTDIIPEDDRYVLNQRMGLLRQKDKSINLGFMRTLININQKYFKLHGQGSSQQNLSKGDILKFKVIAPNKDEQEKIADFLTTVDERISGLQKRVELLQKYKKGMMQKIFTQEIRFKKVNGKDYPAWQEKKLVEVAAINPKTSSLPEEFVYIDLESVVTGRLISKNKIKQLNAPSRAQRLLKPDDILYQTVRPYQRNNLYFNKNGQYVASTGYAQIRARANSRFLYQLVHTDNFVNKVLDYCTGTNYPAINSSDLGGILVEVPNSQEEQHKIAEFLTSLDDKIELTERELGQAKQFKKALLQQMFV